MVRPKHGPTYRVGSGSASIKRMDPQDECNRKGLWRTRTQLELGFVWTEGWLDGQPYLFFGLGHGTWNFGVGPSLIAFCEPYVTTPKGNNPFYFTLRFLLRCTGKNQCVTDKKMENLRVIEGNFGLEQLVKCGFKVFDHSLKFWENTTS